mgnify:CR=1 FL=1
MSVFWRGRLTPLAGKRGIRLEEMVHQSFLLTEKDVSYRLILDQFLASQGLEITPFLEIGNTDYIIRQLILQEGVSFPSGIYPFMPRSVRESLPFWM